MTASLSIICTLRNIAGVPAYIEGSEHKGSKTNYFRFGHFYITIPLDEPYKILLSVL